MKKQYNHTDSSAFTLEQAEGLIGKKAELRLTGEIIDAGESSSGPWVKFQPDERWGFGGCNLVMDADAFDVQES